MMKKALTALWLLAMLLHAGCDTPVTGDTQCVTDSDCNGGLCVEGTCLLAIEGDATGTPGTSDTGEAPDVDTGEAPDVVGALDTSDVSPTPDAGDATMIEDADGEDVPTADVPADTRNLCGGETPLEGVPGSACGDCGGGIWACDGSGQVECIGDVVNGCGGCDPLRGPPGNACGSCGGTWACASENEVECDGPLENACGGCSELPETIGEACGVCGGGVWDCAADDSVTCRNAGATNACGGCGELDASPGARCGTCDSGRWRCAGELSLTCEGDRGDDALNACGGCGPLTATPGDACGTCNEGTYTCRDGRVVCEGDPGETRLNACGGCTPSDLTIGDTCGRCESGQIDCIGANPGCVGDLGEDAENACGGCAELDPIGAECVTPDCEGTLVCDGEEDTACACAVAPCGDGIWDFAGGEACDDGNTIAGDGCDASCAVEGAPNDDSDCDAPFVMPQSGYVVFDSCEMDDNTRPDDFVTGCSTQADAEDVIMEITLTERSQVTIVARDDDGSAAIDPRVYLRSDCDERDSQFACSDDVPCASATVHTDNCINAGGGRYIQPREAILYEVLPAGTHTLVVDTQTYRYGSLYFTCGDILLYVITEPID